MRTIHRERQWKIFLLGVVAALFFSTPGALPVAAQAGELSIIIGHINDDAFPQVSAFATVADGSGKAVTGLSAKDFLAWEDGRPVQVVSALPVPRDEATGITLVLALDVSGSMAGEPLASTREAARTLLSTLRSQDQAALIAFNEKVSVKQPFTSDVKALRDTIDGLEAGGDTAFNDAVFDAAEMLRRLPPGRKAIVIMTDGEDRASRVTIDDAISQARDAAIPVYTIGFGGAAGSAELGSVLSRLAKVTGGHYYSAPTSQELTTSFGEVASLLSYQYQVAFNSALPAQNTSHELTLRVDYLGRNAEGVASFVSRRGQVLVSLTTEPSGDTFGGKVTFTAAVEKAPARVASVQLLLDDTLLEEMTAEPFVYTWDSATFNPGRHTIKVIATDGAGNSGEAEVAFTVVPPITVKVIAPPDGARVSGEVTIQAEAIAAPHNWVTTVEFLWDDRMLAKVSTPPYSTTVNTTQYVAGRHTLLVRAYDAQDHRAEGRVALDVQMVSTQPTLLIVLGIGVVVLAIVIPVALRGRRQLMASAMVSPGELTVAPEAASPVVEEAAGGPTAWLVVEQGTKPGERFPLREGETSLGRSSAENDIKVEGRTASRRQSVIRASGGQFIYFDVSTLNPTIINGQEVVGSHELAEGDRIEIGDMILRFTTMEEEV
jgi:Ca-activated chloride channel family protein